MKIEFFPKIGSKTRLPGVLALHLESPNIAVDLNVVPGSVALITEFRQNFDSGRNTIILPNLNPGNLSGTAALTELIKRDTDFNDHFRLFSPKPVSKWLSALIAEHDYDSVALRKLTVNPYPVMFSGMIADTPDIRIHYCHDPNHFCDYIIKLRLKRTGKDLYYCELQDLYQPFPDELRSAESVVFNLAAFPMIEGIGEDVVGAIGRVLIENQVKRAFMPTTKGICEFSFDYTGSAHTVIEHPLHQLQMANVNITLVHDNTYKPYRSSVFPVTVHDDSGKNGILLGLDMGSLLLQRLPHISNFEFKTVVIPRGRYQRIACVFDLIEQLPATRRLAVVCGKYMYDAITHFNKTYRQCHSLGAANDVNVIAANSRRTTRIQLPSGLDLLMIPYPNQDNSFLVRIQDTDTGESLIYTEEMQDLTFLKDNLQGIYTLIITLDRSGEKLLDEFVKLLKELQKKLRLQRLIVLYSQGSVISDLDI